MKPSISAIPFICIAMILAVYPQGVTQVESERIIARLGPGMWPQWSPDGASISLVHDGQLLVTNADGSGGRVAVTAFSGDAYVWASDSSIALQLPSSDSSDRSYFKLVRFRSEPATQMTPWRTIVTDLTPRNEVVGVPSGEFKRIYGPARLVDGSVGYLVAHGSILGTTDFVPLFEASGPTQREVNWPKVIAREQGENFSPTWGDLWLVRAGDSAGGGQRLTSGRKLGFATLSPQADKVIARDSRGENYVILVPFQ